MGRLSTHHVPNRIRPLNKQAATLANQNLDIDVPTPLRRSLQATNLLLATGTAWARVEAGKQFPSDVLAGAASGRILAIFMHDVFLGLPADSNAEIHARANRKGVLSPLPVLTPASYEPRRATRLLRIPRDCPPVGE